VVVLNEELVPESFTDMVKFLNATSLRYALTVNPTIYVSYIKQFWFTAKIKTMNGEKHVSALVDGQKVRVTESSIRETFFLDDETETTCLANSAIFAGLNALGYEGKHTNLKFQKALLCPQYKFLVHLLLHCLSPKTSGWHEFSTTIASAMICLCKGQPFNFSKMILEGIFKGVKDGSYLLYPRFIQIFIEHQISKTRTHIAEFDAPKLVSKTFTFLNKHGKGFSGAHTNLTPFMVQLVQNIQGEGSGNPTDSHHTPNVTTSATQPTKQYTRRKNKKDTNLPQDSVSMVVPDEAVLDDGENMLARAVTTASSLVAEQDNDNIIKTQTKATSRDDDSSESTSQDGNPSQMENIGGSDDQARLDAEFLSQDSPLEPGHTGRSDEDRPVTHELTDPLVHDDNVNDSPLRPVNTGRSDETTMKLIKELTVTCTSLGLKCAALEDKVLNLSDVVAKQDKIIIKMQKQLKHFKKSRSSTSLRRLKKVGTNQVVSSAEPSTHLEEDASKQGRNEETMGSGEVNDDNVDSVQEIETGIVSGEVPVIGDMDVDSPQDAEDFEVADKSGNEVVMEEVIATQEKVVETLKTLEPEQLVKATRMMGNVLKTLEDSVEKHVENAAIVDSTASGKVNTAEVKDSTAGSSDNAAAEAMVLLSKKTTDDSTSKHTTQLPTQSLPQPITTTITPKVVRKPQKGITIREPAATQRKTITSSSTDKGKGKQVDVQRWIYKDVDFTDIPFDSWPKELLSRYDSAVALKLHEDDQQILLEEEKRQAEELRKYDEWINEKIRIDAEIELQKLIKEEVNETPTFDVQFWIREFTTKKRKQNDAARKKIKILKGTTVKQHQLLEHALLQLPFQIPTSCSSEQFVPNPQHIPYDKKYLFSS
jgi:uncharacterized coiled-coil protein SlyX